MNDPKWERFAGTSANFSHDLSKLGQRGVPTVGIGAYRCNDAACNRQHMAIACIDGNGREISILVEPQCGEDIAKTIVKKLGDIGHNLLALKALRALTLVSEIATMTDTEADFLDGHQLREVSRLTISGGTMVLPVLPRRYGEDDRVRAAEILRARVGRGDNLSVDLALVDSIAEALGMTRAGA